MKSSFDLLGYTLIIKLIITINLLIILNNKKEKILLFFAKWIYIKILVDMIASIQVTTWHK